MTQQNEVSSEKVCDHCGAKLKEWWHTLTPGLVNALIKMLQAVRAKNLNDVHLQTELELSKNEYNNFQKLRFHGLVAKVYENGGEHKKGCWLITRRGGQFLRGELRIAKKVKTFRNQVIGHSEDLVTMNEFRGKVSSFEQNFDFEIADVPCAQRTLI